MSSELPPVTLIGVVCTESHNFIMAQVCDEHGTNIWLPHLHIANLRDGEKNSVHVR